MEFQRLLDYPVLIVVFVLSIVLLILGLEAERRSVRATDEATGQMWKAIETKAKVSQFYLAISFWWWYLIFNVSSRDDSVIDMAHVWIDAWRYGYVVLGALLTAISYILVKKLKKLDRRAYGFRIGWRDTEDPENPPINVIAEVTRMRFGRFHLALLIASVPVLAYPEELIFREWPFVYSNPSTRLIVFLGISIFIFSLAHILSGYDIATLLVMAVVTAGALSLMYVYGGFDAALRLHVAINLMAIPFYGGTEDGREWATRTWRKLRMRLEPVFSYLWW